MLVYENIKSRSGSGRKNMACNDMKSNTSIWWHTKEERKQDQEQQCNVYKYERWSSDVVYDIRTSGAGTQRHKEHKQERYPILQ